MPTTIKESFRQFVANINITDRQETKVANCKNNMISKLTPHFALHPEEARVIGSWDRDTMTRYLFEGDIDVMIILHYGKNKDWDTPNGTETSLKQFKVILEKAYPNTQCNIDRNCVTMQLSDFRLDVIPAFSLNTGGYTIPDTYRREWIPTNPIKFANYITQVNKRMEGDFVPLIKMVKSWNREVGWPLRSFHLECIMYDRYKNYDKSYTYDSMLCRFFEDLPNYIKNACYDPVNGDRVDGYLGPFWGSERLKVINKADSAARQALEAYNDQVNYPSVSIKEWKSLLGEFFPTYG